MRSFFALAVSAVLAGRAAADLNITFGAPLGNITATRMLTIPDGPLKTSCQSSCDPALAAISTCAGQDDCLCSNTTAATIVTCEQCWFTTLINENQPKPDILAGSTPALGAYTAACKALNFTTPMALTLPPNWVGPTDLILNTGETVIAVGVGGILGVSALLLLSNI